MKEFDELIKIVDILHSPKGCPWDRAQKLGDYKKYLMEEAYELIESIDAKKSSHVKEELGDLFLILVVITYFFKKKKQFTAADALRVINTKLVSRHPHVFGSLKLKDRDEVLEYWIKSKAKKKKRKTIDDRLPKSAPALFLSDLFFREFTYINGKAKINTKDEFLKIVPQLKRFFDLCQKGRISRDVFVDMLFELCRTAFLAHFDLENSLKEKVFSEAKKVAYKHNTAKK